MSAPGDASIPNKHLNGLAPRRPRHPLSSTSYLPGPSTYGFTLARGGRVDAHFTLIMLIYSREERPLSPGPAPLPCRVSCLEPGHLPNPARRACLWKVTPQPSYTVLSELSAVVSRVGSKGSKLTKKRKRESAQTKVKGSYHALALKR